MNVSGGSLCCVTLCLPMVAGCSLEPAAPFIPDSPVQGGAGANGAPPLVADTYERVVVMNHPEPQPSSGFATKVSAVGDIDGDLEDDVAVGDHRQVVTAAGISYRGQVTVFSGRTGEVRLTLNSPEPQMQTPDQLFGHSVLGLSDLDGDAVPEIAVGARRIDVGGNIDQGRIYVFRGADGALLRVVENPEPSWSAWFGDQMQFVEDVDGGGLQDMLVSSTAANAVYLVSLETGERLRPFYNPTPSTHSFFGGAIAHLGDVDGDGRGDFAIAAPYNSVLEGGIEVLDRGQVFVYSATGGLLAVLEEPSVRNHSRKNFGFGLGALADLDGDGVRDLAVAAWDGQVFVMSMGPARRGTVLYRLEADYYFFGETMQSIPDRNCDGVDDIAVAARDCGNGGAVFIYSGREGALLTSMVSNTRGARLGSGMARLGSVRADGTVSLAIGAPGVRNLEGTAFAVELPGSDCSGLDPIALINLP
jgi:hypothetical protein